MATPTQRQIDLARKISNKGGKVTFGGKTGDEAINLARQKVRSNGGRNQTTAQNQTSAANFSTPEGEEFIPPPTIQRRPTVVTSNSGFNNNNNAKIDPRTGKMIGTVTRAPEPPSLIKRFGRSFVSGFTGSSAPTQPSRRSAPGLSVRDFGAGLGNIFGIVGFGSTDDIVRGTVATAKNVAPSVKKAAQAGRLGKAAKVSVPKVENVFTGAKATFNAAKNSRVAKEAARVNKILESRAITRIPKNLIGAGARGVAVVQGTVGLSRVTASKEQKEIRKTFDVKTVAAAGFKEQREQLAKQTIGIPGTNKGIGLKSLAFEVSPFFGSKKEVFNRGAEAELRRQGFEGQRLQTALAATQRERFGRGFGEALGFLEISRSAESIGRKGVTKSLSKLKGKSFPKKQAFSTLFKGTFLPIGVAGFTEGVSQEVVQSTARGRKLSAGNAAFGGGVGFLSAGVIGGTIAGLRPNKKGASLALEAAASFSDPFEKPGDILQNVFEFGGRKISGKTKKAPPVLSFGLSPSEVFTFADSSAKKRAPTISKRKVPVSPFSFQPSSLEDVFTPPININNDPKPNTNPFVPTNTITPTDTNTNPFVPINPVTETNIFTDINTNVPTNTATIINTNIPTVSPFFRIPPPLPFAFGAGSGGGGSRTGKRSKFLNELQAGRNVFNELLGGGFGVPAKRTKKRKRKR